MVEQTGTDSSDDLDDITKELMKNEAKEFDESWMRNEKMEKNQKIESEDNLDDGKYPDSKVKHIKPQEAHKIFSKMKRTLSPNVLDT